jgi:hypothetical protein
MAHCAPFCLQGPNTCKSLSSGAICMIFMVLQLAVNQFSDSFDKEGYRKRIGSICRLKLTVRMARSGQVIQIIEDKGPYGPSKPDLDNQQPRCSRKPLPGPSPRNTFSGVIQGLTLCSTLGPAQNDTERKPSFGETIPVPGATNKADQTRTIKVPLMNTDVDGAVRPGFCRWSRDRLILQEQIARRDAKHPAAGRPVRDRLKRLGILRPTELFLHRQMKETTKDLIAKIELP